MSHKMSRNYHVKEEIMRNVQWQFWVYTGWRKKGPDAIVVISSV